MYHFGAQLMPSKLLYIYNPHIIMLISILCHLEFLGNDLHI